MFVQVSWLRMPACSVGFILCGCESSQSAPLLLAAYVRCICMLRDHWTGCQPCLGCRAVHTIALNTDSLLSRVYHHMHQWGFQCPA